MELSSPKIKKFQEETFRAQKIKKKKSEKISYISGNGTFYNHFHNTFYQIFLSPQMKRWTVITYKHGIYELPNELPNDLRLRKLGNIRKVSKLHRMIV